jgi:hypothetical protein
VKTPFKISHPFDQIRFRGFDHEMIMIPHQAISMAVPAKPGNNFTQDIQQSGCDPDRRQRSLPGDRLGRSHDRARISTLPAIRSGTLTALLDPAENAKDLSSEWRWKGKLPNLKFAKADFKN